MLPVIAIVGRPNVGKSTLFNQLSRSRDALVADQAGITRDRQYARAHICDRQVILVDTGGLDESGIIDPVMAEGITRHSLQAAHEADAVIWLLDGRDGLTMMDEKLAMRLRPVCKHLFIAINKTEGMEPSMLLADFHKLGLEPYAISAQRGSGLPALLEHVCAVLPASESPVPVDDEKRLRITVIGRPNVGKSTLVNRMLGEERVLTFDQPGTTRDSIHIPFERNGQKYELIDTAGVRRRSRIEDRVEKISVIKTLQAIEAAQIIVLVVDAQDTVSMQDATLLGLAVDSGKALVIAVNKWDGLSDYDRQQIQRLLDRKLGFVDYACIHTISALHGTAVGDLFTSFRQIRKSITVRPGTSRLTKLLQNAVEQHAPPMVRGRRIKLRYAHLGGHDPLRIIIHGNQTEKLPDSYRRYLANFFRQALKLVGTPVVIELKQGDNPYRGKKSTLSGRQQGKRRRPVGHNRKRR